MKRRAFTAEQLSRVLSEAAAGNLQSCGAAYWEDGACLNQIAFNEHACRLQEPTFVFDCLTFSRQVRSEPDAVLELLERMGIA